MPKRNYILRFSFVCLVNITAKRFYVLAFFKGFNPDISISGIFFKNYFSTVIQYSIEFYQNNIKKIKKYFIFIW